MRSSCRNLRRPCFPAHFALIRELPNAVAGEQSIDEAIGAIARAMEEAELQIPR
jgi:hypothetical protein